MKSKWRSLFIGVAIPLTVGGLAAVLTMGNMALFGMIKKPPLTPSTWVFPIAWTLWYTMMGIASWLVIQSDGAPSDIREALLIYGPQLLVNFIWPFLFFNRQMYLLAFVWLLLLVYLIWQCIQKFGVVSKTAAWLMWPYFLWVIFAGYLNLAIYILN